MRCLSAGTYVLRLRLSRAAVRNHRPPIGNPFRDDARLAASRSRYWPVGASAGGQDRRRRHEWSPCLDHVKAAGRLSVTDSPQGASAGSGCGSADPFHVADLTTRMPTGLIAQPTNTLLGARSNADNPAPSRVNGDTIARKIDWVISFTRAVDPAPLAGAPLPGMWCALAYDAD